MRVPSDIAAAVLRGRDLGFSCQPDGSVTKGYEAGWGGGAYPPPGYLPWNILDVGNGDTYGYYWPLGKEGDLPIVCTLMHDGWELLPVAASLGTCIRLHLLTSHSDVKELVGTAREFGINIGDIAIPEHDEDQEPFPLDGPPWTSSPPGEVEFWGGPSVSNLLPHDPSSPHLRYVAAKEAIAKRELAVAEDHLKMALAVLPEYSEALALLAQVYRQQQNHRRAAESLMEAITSPRCFGARDRKKLLSWLQRLTNDACFPCDDPLWKRRAELTFVDGVKEKDDYRVFDQLIAEYHYLGMGVRAVRLRILAGELMHFETVSFRERQGWTVEKYQSLLRADIERAGLKKRLVAM